MDTEDQINKEIEMLRRKLHKADLIYTMALQLDAPIEIVGPLSEYVAECKQLIEIWRD